MIFLLILPLDKSKIVIIINILYFLVKHFGLPNIIKNRIILIKKNFINIKNIIYTIYQK